MQKIYFCTIYYLLPGIISTPVNKEKRAQYISTKNNKLGTFYENGQKTFPPFN